MTTDNYRQADHIALAQQARLNDCTWEGATVIELTGHVAELFPHVPVFSRHPFRVGGEENRFKDEIRREPLKITDEPMPVATVSKTYSLIQHRDVLASVFLALKMIHIDISGVESSLLLFHACPSGTLGRKILQQPNGELTRILDLVRERYWTQIGPRFESPLRDPRVESSGA